MNHRIISAAMASGLVLTGSLWAHHAPGVLFDFSKELALTGTLKAVDWRNPHIHLSLEVQGDDGEAEIWVMEVASPKWFRDRGVSKDEFESAIGQVVRVEGFHARDGSRNGYLETITFEDGHSIVGFLVNR